MFNDINSGSIKWRFICSMQNASICLNSFKKSVNYYRTHQFEDKKIDSMSLTEYLTEFRKTLSAKHGTCLHCNKSKNCPYHQIVMYLF